MAILFVLLSVAVLLAILTAPVPIKARAYVTLDGFRVHVRLKVAGIIPVHAKVVIKEGKCVLPLNGRKPPRKKKKTPLKTENFVKAAKNLLRDRIVKGGSAAFYVGGEDSARGAIAAGVFAATAALTGQSARTEVYWNREHPVFVFDCGVRLGISLLQTAVALFTVLSGDKKTAQAGKHYEGRGAEGRSEEK